MKLRKQTLLFIWSVILLSIFTQHLYRANADEKLSIGGAFMGVVNRIDQENQTNADVRRQQFDLALNLDFEYVIHPNVRGIVQLQTGPGEGSLGFSGPGVGVTDLSLEIDVKPSVTLSIGSFDTPFCLETQYLTNNADGFNNALLLNSLFYSAFAGTNVGTLNTLGIKGVYTSKMGKLTMALTNGTDEAAFNPDGNFELVVAGCTQALIPKMYLAASFIASNDTARSGAAGTGTIYRGWIVDSRYEFSPEFFVHGFYGQFDYNDQNALTNDKVAVWKAEANYGRKRWHVASRVSRWQPEKVAGNVIGVSAAIPNPGFGVVQANTFPSPDQTITRLQATFGWKFHEDLILKCEWFRDSYGSSLAVDDFYVQGIILGVNARF